MSDRNVVKLAGIKIQRVSHEKYRFIVDQAGQPIMIFTSKSFNMTKPGKEGHVVLSIGINAYYVETFLIHFLFVDRANSFYELLRDNKFMNEKIDIVIPTMWSSLVP